MSDTQSGNGGAWDARGRHVARRRARRLAGSGVTAHCPQPSVVASNFNAGGGTGGIWGFAVEWLRPLTLSPVKGARASVGVCCAPELESVSGTNFERCREAQPTAAARDDAAARRLWELGEGLVGVAEPGRSPHTAGLRR